MTTAAAGTYAPAPGKTSLPGLTGWVLFDWSTQPFYTLIGTFLFAPYFAATFVGQPNGAAYWANINAISALVVAVGSPLLGALADARGRSKPFMAVIAVVFIISQMLLWYAEPGTADTRLLLIMTAVIVATAASEFATVLNNALMPRLVSQDELGRLSGTGWAVGYVGGIVSLLLMMVFVISEPSTGKTMFGIEPLIPHDPSNPAERYVGPLCALWFAIFVMPFFLFTPDAAPRNGEGGGIMKAFSTLATTFANVRRYRNIALFLIAYLLFIDGLMAIFSFGGIYGATTFGWHTTSLGIFGIIITVAGGIGAFIGGFLDDKLGSRTVIVGALILLMIASLGVISIDLSHILFFIEVPAAEPGRALFSSVGEQAYIVFAILIGISAGPLQSASRSFLARMAPPEHMSEFFGIFAFSGKVSAFLAPMTISVITTATGSLRLGMASILIYLAIGLVFMLQVRPQR